MSKEMQIDEMARDMCDGCREAVTAEECQLNCCDGVRQHAEALYARGYRKQDEGEWIYEYSGEELDGTDASLDYKCSLCGELATDPWSFCPNCGAKMKGE